jgi:hypothetical protein
MTDLEKMLFARREIDRMIEMEMKRMDLPLAAGDNKVLMDARDASIADLEGAVLCFDCPPVIS